METEQNLRDKILGDLAILPNEVLTLIVAELDSISLVRFAKTCSYLKNISSERLIPFKIPIVKNFLYSFNDFFKNSLSFEELKVLTDSLLTFYAKYSNEIKVLTDWVTIINDLQVGHQFSFYSEMKSYEKKYEQKIKQLTATQETSNKDSEKQDSKEQNSKSIARKTLDQISETEQKYEIFSIIKVIKLHFLSRLYAKEDQFLLAWYVSYRAFLESGTLITGEHLSAFIGSIAYLKKLEAEDYKKAAKILFCDFKLGSLSGEQIIRIENRDTVLQCLLAYWLDVSKLLPENTTPEQRRMCKKYLLEIDLIDFYRSTSNLLVNFPLASRKYGQTELMSNFYSLMPYLLAYKNIQPLINQLTIAELCSVDIKLIEILCAYVPESQIKNYIEFAVKSRPTIDKILNCAYPKILFELRTNTLSDLDKPENSGEYSKLDTFITVLNAIYKRHYQYSHTEINPKLYTFQLKNDWNFDKISVRYARRVVHSYLQYPSVVSKAILNNLSFYSFSFAKYVFSLNFNPHQLLLLVCGCPNLLVFFSAYRFSTKPDQYKPELERLYQIHCKTDDKTAHKFYQEYIEPLTIEEITILLNRLIHNDINQEITAMFQIFEKNLTNKFNDQRAKKMLEQWSLASLIKLCEAKVTENLSCFDQAKTLNKNILSYILTLYNGTRDMTSFKTCLMHPMFQKINQFDQPQWLQHLLITTHNLGREHNRDFVINHLNFLEKINNINLADTQKIFGHTTVSVFDYVAKLNISKIILHFCYDMNCENIFEFENRMNAFVLANNLLLQKLTLEQICKIYSTFSEVFENVEIPNCPPNFIINVQIICEFIEKFGMERLFETEENYRNKNMDVEAEDTAKSDDEDKDENETEDDNIYKFLAQTLFASKEHTNFQFFSTEPTEQKESKVNAKADIEEPHPKRVKLDSGSATI